MGSETVISLKFHQYSGQNKLQQIVYLSMKSALPYHLVKQCFVLKRPTSRISIVAKSQSSKLKLSKVDNTHKIYEPSEIVLLEIDAKVWDKVALLAWNDSSSDIRPLPPQVASVELVHIG